MREMTELYRATLETFEKFRHCIEYVQTMTSLSDLSEVLDGIRLRLDMGRVRLVLSQEMFGEFVPHGVTTLPAAEIFQAQAELPGHGNGSFLGACACAPRLDVFLGRAFPAPEGSCYLHPLPNKYAPGTYIGVIALHDTSADRFSIDKATDFLDHFCDLFAHTLVTLRDHEQLLREAIIDPLTSAHNRLYLNRHAPRLLALAERKDMPLALVYLDLDRFKPVNDALGHDAGDKVLREVAARIRAAVRAYDIFVRMGGDEFAVFMPDASPEEALSLAKRLKAEIATLDVAACTGQNTDLRLSASVGMATFAPGQTLEELLAEADREMYRGKRGLPA